MICPACGHDNLKGLDACEKCGTDLRTSDAPIADPSKKADPNGSAGVKDANDAVSEEGA